MRWSLKLGTIAGTEIRIHMTFVLLLVWIWFIALPARRSTCRLGRGRLYPQRVRLRGPA